MATHLPPAWIPRLCGLMLIPTCPAVTRFFAAWERAEGGTARYNPMNTTEPLQGAWDYNTAGVKNYPTPIAGLAATALTLQLEPYHGLWVTLQQAERLHLTAEDIVNRNPHALDVWGTGAANVLRVLATLR